VRKSVVCVLVALVLALAGSLVVPGSPAHAVQVGQDQLVSDDPANFTPNVLDGSVKSIQQFGEIILIGGDFSQIQSRDGTTTYSRHNLAAFNATTGEISTAFAPDPDGEVTTIIPSGDGSTAFVAGYFNNISGGGSPSLARIDVTTGARVAGFKAPKFDGRIKDLRLSNGRLWIAGLFTTVAGNAQPALATVNPTTGAYDPYMTLQLAGVHNGGITTVMKLDITPDGSKLVAIGNFDMIQGVKHHQIFMLDLTGPSAAVENWQTNFYNTACSSSYQTYMRDLDISPDGSYFVVTTTGAYGGSLTACDSTARWNLDARGTNLAAKWIDNTGGDTTYAVAVTGTVVYTGGHARWQNNPFSGDRAGQGAVSRPGIAALDPINGLPLSWNPTRDRGVGVFDLLATSTGLWVGSDTDRIGDYEYHARVAYFPLAGGKVIPATNTPTLPNNVYLAGRRGALGYDDTVNQSAYDGTTASPPAPTPNGGLAWRSNRGAFMLNGRLYAGWSDGSFDQRSFDGTSFGAAAPVDTGDLLVAMTSWHNEVQSITGVFFDAGRIYYTMSGQSSLFYRYFTPESNVVGANRFTAASSISGVDLSRVNGMFLAGSTLYWAHLLDGTLRRAGWNSSVGAPVPGTAQTLSTGIDWRSRTLFLYQDVSGQGPNQLPAAQSAVSCTDLNCSYSSAGSNDPDGTITSYAWNFGDGGTGTGASPTHRYAAAGTYPVTLTVTDDDGASAQTTQSITVTHVNVAPTASFTVSCGALSCDVDASASSDPDGPIPSYAWTFGDGGTATGVTASHSYTSGGTFTIGLTVNDGEGGADNTTRQVTVRSDPIDFVGSDSVNANATQFTVTVPPGVSAGDTLLLFFADNDPIPTVTGPDGWTPVQSGSSTNQSARAWYRIATATDAGTQLQVKTSLITKADLTLLAYSATSAATPIAASAFGSETVAQSTHTTPTVTSTVAGARLVSYWGEKSSATTTLAPPNGMTVRSSSTGIGSGRVTSLSGDSGPLAAGTVGGLTATADSSSAKAMMFSIVLAPVG
jgi:PKD repeat protein